MAISWQPLILMQSTDAHLAPLLISTAFKPDSYTIHVTDLTHIWSESLDHGAIIRRSEEESTSIDPSDGDQLQIFLDKIKLGIEGGRNTALALTVNSNAGQPSLTLNITVNLPGGLAPLEWPVHLSVAQSALLTNQLTVPLLQAQHALMQEVTSLTEFLREKDHVIQKLLDKLESHGTELGQIFPQAAGKGGRKVDRKKAEEKVRGLGIFDVQSWRSSVDTEPIQDAAQLVRHVFASEGSLLRGMEISVTATPGQDTRWESLKGKTINLSIGRSATSVPSESTYKPLRKAVLKAEESVQDDDDFEVQATPPSPASAATKSALLQPTIEKSIKDDGDLNNSSRRSSKVLDSFPSTPPPQTEPRRAKNFGKIGGRKRVPKTLPSEDGDSTEGEASSPLKSSPVKDADLPVPGAALSRTKKGLGKIGGKKEPPFVPEPSPPPAKEISKPRRGNLGHIGRNKIGATPPTLSEPEPEVSPPVAGPLVCPSPKKKLGAIGHSNKTFVKEENDISIAAGEVKEERGRSAIPEKQHTPLPRETSIERADRKRQELKRELEQKAKAPIKKKRKF